MHPICSGRCWKMVLLRASLLLLIVFINANAEDTSLIDESPLSKQSSREKRGGNKFLGMRGKKHLCGTEKPCVSPLRSEPVLEGSSDEDPNDQPSASDLFEEPSFSAQSMFLSKRRQQGFAALRGKRISQLLPRDLFIPYDEDHFGEENVQSFIEANKRGRSKGFVGMRGKKQPLDGEKRGPDSGKFFAAMRGKRQKRGPSTFYGVRGKRSDSEEHSNATHQ